MGKGATTIARKETMGQQTTELADMCFDLETKDGLPEGVRHVLMATTMTMEQKATRRDGGNTDTKEEGSDRRVDTKKGTRNDRRVERKKGTKNDRRVEGKMETKNDRRVETKNGRRAEGKMGTKINRRVEGNGNVIGMASDVSTGLACMLAVFLAVLTITVLGRIQLPMGRASWIYSGG